MVKSLYLLSYIDDEAYRRRILAQLNRGEGRHQLARAVFQGKRGELRERYREGPEDQLGALGLVVNVIVLWNTIYMDAALNQLRAEGFEVRKRTWPACRRSACSTSTCSAATPSPCPMPSHAANSGPCETQPHTAPMPTSQPLHRFCVPLLPRFQMARSSWPTRRSNL